MQRFGLWTQSWDSNWRRHVSIRLLISKFKGNVGMFNCEISSAKPVSLCRLSLQLLRLYNGSSWSTHDLQARLSSLETQVKETERQLTSRIAESDAAIQSLRTERATLQQEVRNYAENNFSWQSPSYISYFHFYHSCKSRILIAVSAYVLVLLNCSFWVPSFHFLHM